MNNRIKTIGLTIGILAAMVLMLPLFSVTAQNGDVQREAAPVGSPEGFDNVPPFVIPAAAFRSDGYNPVDDTFFSFINGYMQGDTNDYGCVEAPAYLPQDAYIYEFYASVYDNNPAHSISVTLWRKYIYGNDAAFVLARVTAPTNSNAIQILGDNTINYPRQVPEFRYAYYITTCIHSLERLYAVRIWYNYDETEPVFLPMVTKH